MNLPYIFKPLYEYDLIRLGKDNDGGYLIGLSTVKKTETLISLGIHDEWSFEKDFQKLNHKTKIFLYDDILSYSFLIKKFLSAKYIVNSIKSFINLFDYYFFVKKKLTKKKIKKNSLRKEIKKFKKNIFLKIDIEGSEYEILNEIIFCKKKILGIIIEFHNVDKKISLIINFLERINFKISHIHINNYTNKGKNNIPKTIEISLEKHPKVLRFKASIPHKLDQKNNPLKCEEKLNFI